jgi:hypothetical protein
LPIGYSAEAGFRPPPLQLPLRSGSSAERVDLDRSQRGSLDVDVSFVFGARQIHRPARVIDRRCERQRVGTSYKGWLVRDDVVIVELAERIG